MALSVRILGIDPGLRRMGWGMISVEGSRLSAIAHGVVTPPTNAPLSERLIHLFDAVGDLVRQYRPDEAAIEEAFMAANASSALKLGHARAAALLAPAQAGLPVAEYAARLVKKSVVGTGAADKAQIAAMVGVLLPGTRATADAADALAIAICHAHHRRASQVGSAA
ncbi:crossover junction endodeoxyribonuclease RuvC [Maricaulis sp. W15]|uniref:Crossover junction endodeoxyribonuclease RuvC n=1 Tax=Maricaulis maris TaxID=74318 RepID=A0A495CXZ6_9PROT|nr:MULTISPECIES: crossover junction endodeoxyribonuclease RuvC [Maricaulis]OLF71764.1 crossover junction endodeoxyribonuclease RuvC [Maricaulis sp. W15]RKQ94176.1 Holliday junction endonuclease RuvC [Maricaulis maris]